MSLLQINVTQGKAKTILLFYVIGFVLSLYLDKNMWIKYLVASISYIVFYLGLFTLQILYFKKLIQYLKRKNILDLYMVSTFIALGYYFYLLMDRILLY